MKRGVVPNFGTNHKNFKDYDYDQVGTTAVARDVFIEQFGFFSESGRIAIV